MFLNSIDSNLQFTVEVCGNELYFFDLKLTLKDNKTILGIQNGVALRLRRIYSTDKEYDNKSKEYKAYLKLASHV